MKKIMLIALFGVGISFGYAQVTPKDDVKTEQKSNKKDCCQADEKGKTKVCCKTKKSNDKKSCCVTKKKK